MSQIREPERPDDSTYDLEAEPGDSGNDPDLDTEIPVKPKLVPGQPLPRLWKDESDPSRESDPKPSTKKNHTGPNAAESKSTSAPKSKPKTSSPAKPKREPFDSGNEKDKKVLIEETPKFDTYEARQRARLLVGGLSVFCVILACYIGYRVLVSESIQVVDSTTDPGPMATGAPVGHEALEAEARYMLSRAKEFAKAGRTDQTLAMLKRVVASYKGTESAKEAQAALDRPKQNLPLFPDGPALVARQKSEGANEVQASSPNMSKTPTSISAGPVAMGPNSLGGVGPHNTLTQSPPALGNPVPGSPVTTQPTLIPPVQEKMSQAPPNQAMTPSGPGQVAMIIPAVSGGTSASTTPVEKTDRVRPTITPQGVGHRALPPGFQARPEAGLHESGWPLVIVSERDNALMVLVPGDTFTMGDDRGESAEAPAHTVRLSTFYIDQHEVTNRQFRTFLEESHYRGKPPGNWLSDEKLRDLAANRPAVLVSYRDAENYVIWAGKRLPTEAQWEMSARSTDGRRYPWGDQPVKWSRPREFRQVDPVMSFPEDSSVYGVHDMAGNALEWTRDWFDPRYFQKVGDKTIDNPTGPSTPRLNSILRVVKGGSKTWSVAARQGVEMDKRLPYIGFRGVLAVEGPEASAGINPHRANPTNQPGTPTPYTTPPAVNVPF